MPPDLFSAPLAPTTAAALASLGVDAPTFGALALYVHRLSYRRTISSGDVYQVIREACGTCSSKHRLLAVAARDAGRYDVHLTVGIFRMSEVSTPGVGQILERAGLSFIPEAHCYLTVGSSRFDFTGLESGTVSPFASLDEEVFVEPEALTREKLALHKRAIERWAPSVGLSFEAAWAVREQCIAALAAGQ